MIIELVIEWWMISMILLVPRSSLLSTQITSFFRILYGEYCTILLNRLGLEDSFETP